MYCSCVTSVLLVCYYSVLLVCYYSVLLVCYFCCLLIDYRAVLIEVKPIYVNTVGSTRTVNMNHKKTTK